MISEVFNGCGDDRYEVSATNLRGRTYTWPLATNEDGTFKWGDDDDDFWFTEADVDTTGGSVVLNLTSGDFFIGDEDYFLISENAVSASAATNEKDDSAVYQYKQINTADRQITFRDVATGTQVVRTYTTETTNTAVLGTVDLLVEGTSYSVWIGNQTGNPIAVDLNNDDLLDETQVGFTVRGGALLTFDEEGTEQAAGASGITTGVNFNMSLKVPASLFDDGSANDELNWTVESRANNEMGLSMGTSSYSGPNDGSDEWNRFALEEEIGDDDTSLGLTDFGVHIDFNDPSGDDAETLILQVPETQVGAQVFVVAGSVEAGSSGGTTSQVVNPIAVGLAVLDRDAPALGEENLIVVGGPCANTVAAAFLNNPANCAEGFEPGKAMIASKEYGSTVAILVAGYEAQETLGASRVLAQYEDYNLEGTEVEVVVADLNSIRVQAPSAAAPAPAMDDDEAEE